MIQLSENLNTFIYSLIYFLFIYLFIYLNYSLVFYDI